MIQEFLKKYDDGSLRFRDIVFRKGAAFSLDFGVYSKTAGDFRANDLLFPDKRTLYFHAGCDRAAGEVYAPFDGKIIFDRQAGNYGSMLTLYPDGADFIFRVAHMADISGKAKDAITLMIPVKAGTFLGMAGNIGVGTGPHTHAELVSIGERSGILEYLLDNRSLPATMDYRETLYPALPAADQREWDAYAEPRKLTTFTSHKCKRLDGYRGGADPVTYYNTRACFGM